MLRERDEAETRGPMKSTMRVDDGGSERRPFHCVERGPKDGFSGGPPCVVRQKARKRDPCELPHGLDWLLIY